MSGFGLHPKPHWAKGTRKNDDTLSKQSRTRRVISRLPVHLSKNETRFASFEILIIHLYD